MRRRCNNPHAHAYDRYGGQGVAVCTRWDTSFAAFLRDMGPRPIGASIDRIDGNGDYAPGNVRWATHSQQNLNRRLPKRKRRRADIKDIMAFADALARAAGRISNNEEMARLKNELRGAP
jgi:hypothetical protein